MTSRHTGEHLGIAAFAARAAIKVRTLESYIHGKTGTGRPRLVNNPVPPPCRPVGGPQGNRQWCEKHADQWIDNRARRPKSSP